MRVAVYRNLNKPGVWYSVKALEGSFAGRVIGHMRTGVLTDVKTKVSQSGRQRVIATQRKNVHAFVEGTLVGSCDYQARLCTPKLSRPRPAVVTGSLTYNPYAAGFFYNQATKKPVHECKQALFTPRGILYSGG